MPKKTREQYPAWCDREEVEVTFDGLHCHAGGQVHFRRGAHGLGEPARPSSSAWSG